MTIPARINFGEKIVSGKEAYTLTHDPRFWGFAKASNIGEAAAFVSEKCGVQALRFIDDTPEAIAKWQELKAQYDSWLERNANGGGV